MAETDDPFQEEAWYPDRGIRFFDPREIITAESYPGTGDRFFIKDIYLGDIGQATFSATSGAGGFRSSSRRRGISSYSQRVI